MAFLVVLKALKCSEERQDVYQLASMSLEQKVSYDISN